MLALLVFNLINSNIGFMKMASSVLCTVGLAVVCTFLPLAVMTAAATVLIVAHLYTLSMPIARSYGDTVFVNVYFLLSIYPGEELADSADGSSVRHENTTGDSGYIWAVRYYSMDCPCILRNPCLLSALPDQSFCNSMKGTDGTTMISTLTNFTKQFVGYQEMWVMLFAVVIGILVVNGIKIGQSIIPGR